MCIHAFVGIYLRSPLSSSVVAILEHVFAVGVQSPVVSFAWFSFLSRDFHEAVVQAQVVTNGVLPALLVLMVVREPVHDELVDTVQCYFTVRSVLHSHGDERNVAVRWFLRLLPLLHVGDHLQSVPVVIHPWIVRH